MQTLEEAHLRAMASRGRQALQPEMMFDTIRCGSTILYRPTLVHAWLINGCELSPPWKNSGERRKILGCILMRDAQTVRDELFRDFETGMLSDRAAVFPEALFPVVERVLDDLRPKRTSDAGGELEYGWWARVVAKIAFFLHFSEKEIFAIPLARLREYLIEIDLLNGVETVRDIPPTPEDKALQALMEQQQQKE